MTVRPQVWVGIDVGKLSHHACAVDANGKVVWTQKLANEQRAIEAVIERARKSAEQVRWAIDLTSPIALMLITVLLAAEEAVVYVPGRVVNTMTGAFRGEGKTDAKDARVIAQTARMRTDLADVTMPGDLVVESTQLTGYRTDLMADWVRGINRLRSLLGSIFPALEAAFDYSTRTPLILVGRLCTPAEIRAAGTEGATAHLQANKAWAPGIAKTAATAVGLWPTTQRLVAAWARRHGCTGEADRGQAARAGPGDQGSGQDDRRAFPRPPVRPNHRIAARLGTEPGCGVPGRHPSDLALLSQLGGSRPSQDLFLCPRIRVASAAIFADPNASTVACGRCSIWRRCPACAPADRLGSSMTANAVNASSTARRCSPWRGAWSTCCGHCCVTGESSPSTSLHSLRVTAQRGERAS